MNLLQSFTKRSFQAPSMEPMSTAAGADQIEYSAKTKRKPIGETQTGDRILELKDDPNHQYFVLIFNTEMPWWDLYEKK